MWFTPVVSPEQSEEIVAEIEAASARARRLFEGMDTAALTRRPSAISWNVAECLQHLVMTSKAMRSLIEPALVGQERAGARSNAPAGLGLLGWLLVKMLEPPVRFKTQTAASFVPVNVPAPADVLPTLCAENEKIIVLTRRAAGLASAATTIVSPFNARARYNAYAALRITATHLRRHLWQAEQAKASRAGRARL